MARRRFPKYKPTDNKISIWSELYGGHYGPSFASFFTEQNRKIADGTISGSAVALHLDTVGIVNGCIDILTQMPGYAQMAYNNTYGIQVISETEYNAAVSSFPACRARVNACQALADSKDPTGLGNDEEVNKACSDAYNYCMGPTKPDIESRGVSLSSHMSVDVAVANRGIQRNVFDITATVPGSFPPKYAGGFLYSKNVQLELGVPLNISGLSMAANIGTLLGVMIPPG